jgi:two-component system nitrate/nitrite response regulator NarL
MDRPIRILIADDHPIMRDGLRKLLEAEEDFVVAGEASNGHEALQTVQQLEPDLLLLDLLMPGVPYLEVLRSLHASTLATRTLLLTASIQPDDLVKALQLGARGVVMKDAATQMLMKAIRKVMSGEYWIGRDGVAGLVDTFRAIMAEPPDRRFGLTARELEIVATVTGGLTNREIAQRFSLSEETVKHHLTKVFGKLGVSNRLELALFAINHHLIEPLPASKPK